MTTGTGLGGVQHWLAREAEGTVVELVCAEHVGPVAGVGARTVVRLPTCAVQIAVHELVELLTLGAARVLVRLDGCADHRAARRHLQPTVDLLQAGGVDRLSILGPEADDPAPPVTARRRGRVTVLDARAMPISRRGLLGLTHPGARELPEGTATPKARLIAAVAALVTPSPSLTQRAGPTLTLTAAGCVACGVCVQACPERALRLVDGSVSEDVSISTLRLDPAACTGCTRCVDLCPTHVLAVGEPVTWGRLLDGTEEPVVTVTTALCARCGVRLPLSAGSTFCAVCTYRRRNPFGSTVAPGSVAHASDA